MNTDHETRATSYAVLAQREPVQSLLEIKRSEFIAFAQRVESEAEARAFIESLRKQYHDARHVCSAFVIGADREIQRSSDDGEPAGTAGIPMLQAILARRTDPGSEASITNLSDICVVVVRYFGGIKLGAGGLVRAYTDAVVQVLDETTMTQRRRLRAGAVKLPHAEAGKFENEVRALGFTIISTEYFASHAVVTLGVFDSPVTRNEAKTKVAELTMGKGEISWGETSWVDEIMN